MKKSCLFLRLAIAFILFSCNKEENIKPSVQLVTTEMTNGLPANIKTIDGYLYADHEIIKENYFPSLHLFAAFRDPASHLLTSYNHYENSYWSLPAKATSGNVDVGQTLFNDVYGLNSSTSQPNFLYYYNAPNTQSDTAAKWSTEGNKTFCSVNLKVERGFPSLNLDTSALALINLNGFTLDLSNSVSNYDSLVVLIDDNLSSTAQIRKGFGLKNTPIEFSANDLKSLWPAATTGNISVYVFNYSHKVIQNRLYVFELSNKYSRRTKITK